jgi:hypothetical protein
MKNIIKKGLFAGLLMLALSPVYLESAAKTSVDPKVANTRLLSGVLAGNVEKIRTALNGGADPNMLIKEGLGEIPAFFKVKATDVGTLKLFVEKGINPLVRDRNGNTLLHHILSAPVNKENSKTVLELVSTLIQFVGLKTTRNNFDKTPSNILNIEEKDDHAIEIMRLLGLDIPDERTRKRSRDQDPSEIVGAVKKLSLEKTSESVSGTSAPTPSTMPGTIPTIMPVIPTPAPTPSTAPAKKVKKYDPERDFHRQLFVNAFKKNPFDLDEFDDFLVSGFNPNAPIKIDDRVTIPLLELMRQRVWIRCHYDFCFDLTKMLNDNLTAALALFINHGADVNHAGAFKMHEEIARGSERTRVTPIMLAAMFDSRGVVTELLLRDGADITMKDGNGQSVSGYKQGSAHDHHLKIFDEAMAVFIKYKKDAAKLLLTDSPHLPPVLNNIVLGYMFGDEPKPEDDKKSESTK